MVTAGTAALQRLVPCIAGYDWGGLASCVVAALWPQSIAGLVSLASYDIVNIADQQQARTSLDPSCDGCLPFWLHDVFTLPF